MAAMGADRLRVLIADDNAAVREQLSMLLSGEPDLAVVGVAAHGFEAVRMTTRLEPDVLVLDQDMPGLDGLGVLRALRNQHVATRVIFYTLSTEACDEAEAIGATACLGKDASLDVVLDAVRAAGNFSRSRRRRPAALPAHRSDAPRVLVVDDDEAVRSILRESLESAGYTTQEAADGEEAIRTAASFRPDVIVLDLMLPLVGGRDVLRAYRRMPDARAKVVALSGLPRASEIAHEIGADAGITKPFDLDTVMTTIGGLAPA